MDEAYLVKAAAYVELNPVKVKMVQEPWDYRWSSVHAHLSQRDSLNIINPQKLIELCGDWKTYLHEHRPVLDSTIEQHLNTGRPLGGENFIDKIEVVLG